MIGKYIAGALLLGLAGCASLPITVENYRERAKVIAEGYEMVYGLPFYGRYYSIDGDDSDAEIGELYMPGNLDGEPVIYGFDIDNSGVFDEDEMFIDKEMDGWNGNEVRVDQIEDEERAVA